VSKKDLARLQKDMDKGQLFPSITDDATRSAILARLRTIDYPIPTLYTFFRDLRYLAVGKDVMKHLFEPPSEVKITIDEGVAGCFRGSADSEEKERNKPRQI
jgi:hypothetical protein